jgi:hypothetical protein
VKLLDAMEKHGLLVSNNKKWMILNNGYFYVYERKAYKKRATILISTEVEEDAVEILLGE